MRNLKLVFVFAAVAGLITFSACSSSRKKTTDTVNAPQESLNTVRENPPTYAMANLGASTSGRSK